MRKPLPIIQAAVATHHVDPWRRGSASTIYDALMRAGFYADERAIERTLERVAGMGEYLNDAEIAAEVALDLRLVTHEEASDHVGYELLP